LEGCTPLEFLLHLMREAFIQGDEEAWLSKYVIPREAVLAQR